MKTCIKYLGLVILCLISTGKTKAQDPHFSQYQLAPLFFNPAFTGFMDEEAHRFVIKYRNQWSSVLNSKNTSLLHEQAFQTYLASYDGRLFLEDGFLTFGGQLYTQTVDFPSYQILHGKLTGGYHLELKAGIYLGMGLEMGWRNYGIGTNELTFDNQFNANTGFHSTASTGEPFDNRSDLSLNFMEIGGGIVVYGTGHQTEWVLGASVNNALIGKDFSFLPQDLSPSLDRSELKRKLTFQGSILFHNRYDYFSRKHSTTLRLLWISQGPHWQLHPVLEHKRYFKQHKTRTATMEMSVGVGPRITSHSPRVTVLTDAIVLFVTTDLSPFMTLGLSYDLNISPLRKVSNFQGGPELSFIYKIKAQSPFRCPKI